MSNAKHTPGPWTPFTHTFASARRVLEDHERMLCAGGLHNFTITSVEATDPVQGDLVCIANLGNGPTALANAALIAAAPDLLGALIAAEEDLDEVRGRHDPASLALVRAAIAKAKGGAR